MGKDLIMGLRKAKSKLLTGISSVRRQLWLYRSSKPSTVVFIIGNGRSGTNMLAHQLGKSWQVNLYNEDHPAAFQNWHLRDFATIERLVAESSSPLTLFKAQQDTYRMPVLLSKFQNAKVLFVFRHFDDVVNSARKKFWTDFNPHGPKKFGESMTEVESWVKSDFAALADFPPPEAVKDYIRSRWTPALSIESNIALHWLFRNRLYFELGLDQDERIRLVHYETMVTQPESEFRSICQFLGIGYEDVMVKGIFSSSIHRNAPQEIDPQIRQDCEEIWLRLCRQVEIVPSPNQ